MRRSARMTSLSCAAAAGPRGWWPRPPSCPPWPVRPLSRRAGSEAAAEPAHSGPIPFSTSKASPRVWSVRRSMGSDHQRPWVRVLPVSLLGMGLLLWCYCREETEIDEKLGALLYEQVPGLLNETPKSQSLPPPEQENP